MATRSARPFRQPDQRRLDCRAADRAARGRIHQHRPMAGRPCAQVSPHSHVAADVHLNGIDGITGFHRSGNAEPGRWSPPSNCLRSRGPLAGGRSRRRLARRDSPVLGQADDARARDKQREIGKCAAHRHQSLSETASTIAGHAPQAVLHPRTDGSSPPLTLAKPISPTFAWLWRQDHEPGSSHVSASRWSRVPSLSGHLRRRGDPETRCCWPEKGAGEPAELGHQGLGPGADVAPVCGVERRANSVGCAGPRARPPQRFDRLRHRLGGGNVREFQARRSHRH
jgi:hypothetical protein